MFLANADRRVPRLSVARFQGDVCNPNTTIPRSFKALRSNRQDSNNISPLYRLDAFDWTVLILYFSILGVLAVYGLYRVKQVVEFWRYRKCARAEGPYSEEELPHRRATAALQ